MIGWRERNPMEMDGEAGDENREIKIDTGKASKAERNGEKVELFHGPIIRPR